MTPDPKLDALGLVPRRVPTEALLAEAAREHAAELARLRAVRPPAALARDPVRTHAADVADTLGAMLGAVAVGAILQAWGGWPVTVAVVAAGTGALTAWAVCRVARP